jgi:predicted aspartyl protease
MAELGDGSVTTFDVHLSSIVWHDRIHEILVLRAEGGALLGMGLLHQNRLTIDVVPDGYVEIHPIERA